MMRRISGSLDAVWRSIKVPNNTMVWDVGDQTVVECNGEILYTFDPMEEKQ